MRHLLFVILILMTAAISFGVELKDIYEWNYVDFVWDNYTQKEKAIRSGNYNKSACILYDVDMAQDGTVFVTSAREPGVPASLMTVTDIIGPGGPLLSPYPNWLWYNNHDCKRDTIISVYRVSIKCNHIFVLDCGIIGNDTICPPKLLIFDLENDELVQRINIPPHIAKNKNGTGLLVTPLAYVRDCRHINDATVFMADIEGYGLAIYNENSGFCRIESDYMIPKTPVFTIEGESFTLEDGPIGLAIIKEYLFYNSLAGNAIYKMNMCSKQECSELNTSEANKLTQLAGTLSGQSGPIASKHCALFFSNIPETSILCQDATKEFNSTNTEVVAQNSEKLQFPSGLKVKDEMVICLTNRFQRVMDDTLNLTETNFRVLGMEIAQIQNETNCFASCNDDHHKHHGHHRHWHHKHGRPWNRRPWNRRPWDRRPWDRKPWNRFNNHDDHDKYDKHNEHDKNDKYDKHDEHDEHDKNDKNDKQDEKYF